MKFSRLLFSDSKFSHLVWNEQRDSLLIFLADVQADDLTIHFLLKLIEPVLAKVAYNEII